MPADVARRLAFYTTGYVSVVAPRGWRCGGGTGATGALFISVSPEGGFVARSNAPAVTAYFGSPGTGEVGGVACPFFPNVKDRPNPTCPVPASERVVRLGVHTVAFEDPPHVTGTGQPSGGPMPANGVVVYNDSNPRVRNAAQETCTLPESKHEICTAILNDFIQRYPLYRYPV